MAALPPSYSLDSTVPGYAATVLAASASEALPAYDLTSAPQDFIPSEGINRRLPRNFRVADQNIAPLVQPSDLEAHLVLLGAFHRLREDVRTQKGKADINLQPDERWAVFLERAVYRFECWAQRMIGGEINDPPIVRLLTLDERPPLDVIMVWHTYMLNPRTYCEDCLRKFPGLFRIGSFPLSQLCSTIDKETLLPHPPTESRVAAFGSFTGQPFHPPLNTTSEDTVAIFCPSCSQPNSVPWITYKGDGFGQRAFSVVCSNCSMPFNRETLGVRKFYEDVERCTMDPNHNVLANTLVDYYTGIVNEEISKQLTAITLYLEDGRSPVRPEELGRTSGWTMADVETYCRTGYLSKRASNLIETPRGLDLIIAPYHHAGPASLNLANAIIRQMSFIEKMVQLGWTEPGRFEDDKDTLTRCTVRYHHFIDLMACTPGKFVVPTLDIDLAWHTHQLFCTSYRTLANLIGIIPDHDDKVSQGALSKAYDETAAAWKTKFNVAYSVCGCLPPSKASDIPSGGGISSLFSRKGKSKVVEVFKNPRPDLVSLDDMNADETHPSDHNGVAILNPAEHNAALEQLRRRELAKRAKELEKVVEKGKANGWTEVQYKRTPDHSQAFLCPVHYGTKDPFGKYGHGDCAAMSGGGIQGNFMAGECCKGSGHSSVCGADFEYHRITLEDSLKSSVLMQGDRKVLDAMGMAQTSHAFGMMAGLNF